MRLLSSVYSSITGRVESTVAQLRDFRTSRKIVVFESDDWGSIRMTNRKDWLELQRLGYAVDKRPYERFDTLESPIDLEALFDVLSKFKDQYGNHPIITMNMLVANPNFERIEASDFSSYYYESVADTYAKYFGDAKVIDIMRQGLDSGLLMPQSHGREHFNIQSWMDELQSGNVDVLTAFRYKMCGIAPKAHPEKGNQLMVAFASNPSNSHQILKIVDDGLNMFEELWGFKSSSFIAPCYTWNELIEKVLFCHDVKLIQGCRVCRFSDSPDVKHIYMGQRNKWGQIYNVRNCMFEPSTDISFNTAKVIKEISHAFSHHKVAVISAHRINFVGGIEEKNRTTNLKYLKVFLSELLRLYPDVEFLSSDKLINLL